MWFLALKAVHVLSYVLLAATLFGVLVAANERKEHAPAFDYPLDRCLEDRLGRGTRRAIIFLTTSLLTGLLLVSLSVPGWAALAGNTILLAKLALWTALAAVLHYLHLAVRRKIVALLEECSPGDIVSDGYIERLLSLRSLRRDAAAFSLFLVVCLILLGMQVNGHFPLPVNVVLFVLAALFALRARGSTLRLGWF